MDNPNLSPKQTEILWEDGGLVDQPWLQLFALWAAGHTDELDFQQNPAPRRLQALLEARARLAAVEALCDDEDPEMTFPEWQQAARAAARGEGDRPAEPTPAAIERIIAAQETWPKWTEQIDAALSLLEHPDIRGVGLSAHGVEMAIAALRGEPDPTPPPCDRCGSRYHLSADHDDVTLRPRSGEGDRA